MTSYTSSYRHSHVSLSAVSPSRVSSLDRSRRQTTRSVRVRCGTDRLQLGQASGLDLGLGRCSIP